MIILTADWVCFFMFYSLSVGQNKLITAKGGWSAKARECKVLISDSLPGRLIISMVEQLIKSKTKVAKPKAVKFRQNPNPMPVTPKL